MKKTGLYLLMILAIPLFTHCRCSLRAIKKTTVVKESLLPRKNESSATAPALVYKTRKDYSKYVPVIMNESKTKIVAYPDPTDIYYEGKLAYPTPLSRNFLLDNRGIGINVAFLNFTYEAYSLLKEPPTMEQMLNNLLDKDPLLELWNCGSRSRFKEEVKELNLIILKGFPDCEPLMQEPKVQLR